jgi:hypothetical protein
MVVALWDGLSIKGAIAFSFELLSELSFDAHCRPELLLS